MSGQDITKGNEVLEEILSQVGKFGISDLVLENSK